MLQGTKESSFTTFQDIAQIILNLLKNDQGMETIAVVYERYNCHQSVKVAEKQRQDEVWQASVKSKISVNKALTCTSQTRIIYPGSVIVWQLSHLQCIELSVCAGDSRQNMDIVSDLGSNNDDDYIWVVKKNSWISLHKNLQTGACLSPPGLALLPLTLKSNGCLCNVL